jgi:hypothetical protein
MKKSAPDDEPRSPIPLLAGSNGEHPPREPDARDRAAERLLREMVDERHRKLGRSRRDFLRSAAGAATALAVINQVHGCGDDAGGGYEIDAGATWDADQACEALGGDEFIFDVQTHHVNPDGPWVQQNPAWKAFFEGTPQGSCGEIEKLRCLDAKHYLREMFVHSDTHVAVLSAVPAEPGQDPLTTSEQAGTRELVEMLSGSPRLVIHGLVLPDRGAAQLDGMQALAETLKIAAWKVYTPYGNWKLNDATGTAFLERARQLGVKVVCAHKGLPLVGFDPQYAAPDDVGPAAAANPDIQFLIYHSAFETSVSEGPYDAQNPQGIDRLIKSFLDAGSPPNVYAELGSTWRYVMTDPTQAAHVLGKLLKHLGPDRIVWGTDSIFYGSPQDQIMALRAFQIAPALREQHGYPEITAEIRAKIFGRNAATVYGVDPEATRCAIGEDDLAQLRAEARRDPPVRAPNLGPQTRREWLAFLRAEKRP